MAGKINPDGADVIGKTFEVQTFPGVQITVGGVFKDVPKNTHLYYDVLVSLSTFKAITGWSKDDQWLGGDSFNAYVLPQPGCRQTICCNLWPKCSTVMSIRRN